MESTIISESTINGSKVSFYCVSGTPAGNVFVVSAPGESKFFTDQETARATYVKKAKALLEREYNAPPPMDFSIGGGCLPYCSRDGRSR